MRTSVVRSTHHTQHVAMTEAKAAEGEEKKLPSISCTIKATIPQGVNFWLHPHSMVSFSNSRENCRKRFLVF